MWTSAEVCRACRNTARAVAGACADCHRTLARLWGGRCSRCAKRHWITASCHDCLSWTSSIEAGRCRACRDFTRYNPTLGTCRSCARALNLNRYGRCRLCTTARREAHLAGAVDWQSEPGERGGIQLFVGDLPRRAGSQARHEDLTTTGATTASGPAAVVVAAQLTLMSVPAVPGRVVPPVPAKVTAVLPAELATAVATCAAARGWKPATTTAVSQAMALLVELGSPQLSPEVVAALAHHRLPVSRVREFLDASGMSTPAAAETAGGWLPALLAELPAQMRGEVAAWVEVLEGHERSPARTPHTIRHYLNAVQPALTSWSGRCSSLREITTDDVAAQLDGLHGSARTLTAVALRSLFAALKARRLVFVDPARTIRPGRFPRTPVLGLDDTSRTNLLATLPRPDHRVVVLLAGVHALRRADMLALRLDDIDLDAATMTVRATRRPLDRLMITTIVAWLDERRRRWPHSANPHLLVTYKSAYGLGPASTRYITGIFKPLPTTAAGLRADRLLGEAQASGGDPLRLARLFGLSAETAVRYCTELDLTTETGIAHDGR